MTQGIDELERMQAELKHVVHLLEIKRDINHRIGKLMQRVKAGDMEARSLLCNEVIGVYDQVLTLNYVTTTKVKETLAEVNYLIDDKLNQEE